MFMKKKKILIVSASFYPLNSPRSFRTTELAQELSKQGHDVVLYIPFKGYDYTEFAEKKGIDIRDLGDLRFKSLKIKGKGIELLIRRLLRRSIGLLFEFPNIEYMFKVASCLKLESGYDLLISIAVPHPIHWGVASVRKKRNNVADVWVADCGDPYMGDTTDSFRKPFYFKYLEKWFCKKADKISVPFQGAVKAYYKEFHNKIEIIPQGFDLSYLGEISYSKTTDYPVFAYAGGFIPGKRDPYKLLDFLSENYKDFKFIVYTSQASLLASYKEKLKEKLEIREYIPREELLQVLSKMDFLVNFDNNTTTQLPSKLIDYSIADRPVLNITSNLNTNTIHEFMEGNYSGKMNLLGSENYDIRLVAKKFTELHK
ncbi:glycosyltransferase family 4 protein [Labilibacter sediminis]|nr:glycosyltransferase family 4 protein [Labilibacter sediminis]